MMRRRTARGRSARDYPFFDNGGLPLAFAHRGGAHSPGIAGIENTMVAFAAAVALGFRYVETDVHATADGVLLAFHDGTLDRVTDLSGRVADLPYAQVRSARIAGREPVALLADILTSWPELRVNIDCKAPQAMEPLARVVAQHRAADRVCVASFSTGRLNRLRELLGPRVATAYGPLGVAALRLAPSASLLRRLPPSYDGMAAQVPVAAGRLLLVKQAFVDRVHELGRQVHAWTVDEPAEIDRLLDLGVDGIMTDRTDVLRRVLTARGAWPT